MVRCDTCHKEIEEKDALKRKNDKGEQEVICPDCFKEIMGMDYKTFAYRRAVMMQTLLACLFCLGATVYAFVEKGALYGAAGIVLTILVYVFSVRFR